MKLEGVPLGGRVSFALVAVIQCVLVALLWFRPIVHAEIAPRDVRHIAGKQYGTTVPDVAWPGYRLAADSADAPRRSNLQLLQDDKPLRPAHALHQSIETGGHGAFSHWGDGILFSTRENTDPRSDGHQYRIRASLEPLPPVRLLLLTGILGILLLWVRPILPRFFDRSALLVNAIKLAAIAAILVAAPGAWLDRAREQEQLLIIAGRWFVLSAYLFGVAISIVGLFITPFIRDWRVRVPLALVLLAGFFVDQVFREISGDAITLDMMETFWRERDMAGGAFAMYASVLRTNLLFSLVVAAAICSPPAVRLSLQRRWAAMPAGALALVAGVMIATGARVQSFPSPYAVPSQLFIAGVLPASAAIHKRDAVIYDKPLRPVARKIVMIVDESVRGDYLGLNNAAYDNTPFLRSARTDIANYGIATSAANCSVAARLIMRMGLRPDQLPDTEGVWRRQPTLWDFAHKAGLKTVLLDMWRVPGTFHSYMDAQEARSIDVHLGLSAPASAAEGYRLDESAADRLIELLRDDQPMLIYVNKWGIHPPYAWGSPPDLAYDPSPLVASLPLDKARRDAVRDYHKVIRWSVDAFFEKVLPEVERNDAVLLYTSDHGQSLYEGGYDLSHCSLTSALHVGEVLVPLFLAAGSPELRTRFQAGAAGRLDRATHFEVFPTLLGLMGYSEEWVGQHYGSDLFNFPPKRKRSFLLGTFYSPDAYWVDVE